jgi:hypothetical protein
VIGQLVVVGSRAVGVLSSARNSDGESHFLFQVMPTPRVWRAWCHIEDATTLVGIVKPHNARTGAFEQLGLALGKSDYAAYVRGVASI